MLHVVEELGVGRFLSKENCEWTGHVEVWNFLVITVIFKG